MDIISHGLWGGATFGRQNKKSFWLAFFFGIMPDLLAFGPFFVSRFLGFAERSKFTEPPNPALIPAYAHSVYSVTHSLIIFTAVFLLVWLIFRKPFWQMSAWGLHILMDIPTHSYQFFPTPFLWPISDLRINGYSWGSPEIFFPNVALLVLVYLWIFVVKRKKP